jgi:hypothetical protein
MKGLTLPCRRRGTDWTPFLQRWVGRRGMAMVERRKGRSSDVAFLSFLAMSGFLSARA